MAGWQDLAARLDRTTVETFDHGDVTWARKLPDGSFADPVVIPGTFDAGYGAFRTAGGEEAVGIKPMLTIHYGHFAGGIVPKQDDRIVIGTGPAAGTYKVDEEQPNEDRTGAVLPLVKQ